MLLPALLSLSLARAQPAPPAEQILLPPAESGAPRAQPAALWAGDWRDLRLLTTMVYSRGGVAILGTPDGGTLTVRPGDHLGARFEEVLHVHGGRVELYVETDDAREPCCVLAMEMAPPPPTLDDKGNPLPNPPGPRLVTQHTTVTCAATREAAVERAHELWKGR